MQYKQSIVVLLLSLTFWITLMGGSSEVWLRMHNDFSFHLDLGALDESSDAGDGMSIDGSENHSHQNIKLAPDSLPTIRTHELDRVYSPSIMIATHLLDFDFSPPDCKALNLAQQRAPPDVIPTRLLIAQTQVLRL